MNERTCCKICSQEYPMEELTEFEGQLWCQTCLDSNTVICRDCGTRIHWDANEGNCDLPLCHNCREENYVRCSDCGMLMPQEDAYYMEEDSDEPLCYECWNRERRTEIHDYYYKPEPLFYGDGPRYFGVELEIDEGGESCRNARAIMNIANGDGDEKAYCKHDGSLDDGFEIVTHPMTLAYQLHYMPWEEIMRKASSLGYTSHQSGTCGLHVHISRLAFGETEEQQDACIARVLYFFERNWEELLRFSRRTRRQLEQWAARYGYQDQPQEILAHAKNGNLGRYTCVNLNNRSTIEFRMFRGTLKYNTFVATLQLVNHICDLAIHLEDKEIKTLSWSSFAAAITEPELIQYLKERRLYVNEPIETETEV